jgi:hypothetical protein
LQKFLYVVLYKSVLFQIAFSVKKEFDVTDFDNNQDINVASLVKGRERYIFLYDDASAPETLRLLGRFASNPELSLTWYDAAILSQRIRQTQQKSKRR